MNRLLQLSLALVGIVFLVGLAGCNSDTGPATVSVKGTLTIDGQPANDVTITFVPTDSSLPTASGPVSNGSFELFSGVQGKAGAVPGKYKVVLAQAASADETPDYMASGGDPTLAPAQELPFPEIYKDASTSDKEVEVTSGDNDIKIDI
jgi:hypothetical protein